QIRELAIIDTRTLVGTIVHVRSISSRGAEHDSNLPARTCSVPGRSAPSGSADFDWRGAGRSTRRVCRPSRGTRKRPRGSFRGHAVVLVAFRGLDDGLRVVEYQVVTVVGRENHGSIVPVVAGLGPVGDRAEGRVATLYRADRVIQVVVVVGPVDVPGLDHQPEL